MEKIKAFFKNLKWSQVLLAAVFVLFGLLLLLRAAELKQYICDIIGIALVVIGLVHVTQYFLQEMSKSYYSNDFMEGVIMVMLGILAIYQKAIVQELVPYMLAIAVIGSGVSKLQDGIDAKRMGDHNVTMFLILAVVSMVLGFIVMFNIVKGDALPYQVAGAGLLYSGATDLFSVIYLSTRYSSYLKNGTVPPQAEEETEPAALTDEEPAPYVPTEPVTDNTQPAAPAEPAEPQPEAPAETPAETPADTPAEENQNPSDPQ
jgi:uncharacterized membrane protein HdeD (DUF308 family)